MAVRDVVQAAAGVGGAGEYIEDVFSTYLYTGNDSTQTINNGIDLDGEGGMVWTKARNVAQSHALVDTVRGLSSILISNSSNAATINAGASPVQSVSATGYVAGVDYSDSTRTYASWTFRKAPKFFDVVTWTGTGSARTIAHALGAVPGCIIVKHTGLAVVLQGLVRPRLRGTELEFWRNSEEARTDRPSQQLRSLNGEWRLMRYFLLTHLCGISHRIWCTLSTICSDAA